jgi:hypothetical protein
MRTSDPAAYDEFIPLSTGTALNHQFRALYYTHTTTATASFVITYNRVDITTGLVTTTTKTIVINLPAGGSFLLPISGDAVTATFASGTAYALI